MRHTILALLAALYLGGTLTLGITHAADARYPTASITEDDARWDCRMMGDRQCGFTPLFVLQHRP